MNGLMDRMNQGDACAFQQYTMEVIKFYTGGAPSASRTGYKLTIEPCYY